MRRLDLIDHLSRLRSRGEIKKFGERVDREPMLRDAVIGLAGERGVPFDSDWSGKKLVRATLAREAGSRIRSNPIHRDESFRCKSCGLDVSLGGAQVRDHCPSCLRGLHVDCTPGDRAADCGGILEPTKFELSGQAGVVIHYRCRRCKYEWRGRAHPDDAIPPSLSVADLPSVSGVMVSESKNEARARTLPMRVLEHIRTQKLWSPGQRVCIAVSGGLDSSVLMEILV